MPRFQQNWPQIAMITAFIKKECECEPMEVYASPEEFAFETASQILIEAGPGMQSIEEDRLKGSRIYETHTEFQNNPFPLIELGNISGKLKIKGDVINMYDEYRNQRETITPGLDEQTLRARISEKQGLDLDLTFFENIIAGTLKHILFVGHGGHIPDRLPNHLYPQKSNLELNYFEGALIIPEKKTWYKFGQTPTYSRLK
jgi:hypothetical protein